MGKFIGHFWAILYLFIRNYMDKIQLQQIFSLKLL